MMTGRKLATLQFSSTAHYEVNLQTLCTLIEQTPEHSLCVAPEVCVTDFDYPNMAQAAAFSHTIDQTLCQASQSRTIITTMIEQTSQGYVNRAKLYHNGAILHTQDKHKLFTLGEEQKHFVAGELEKIHIVEVDDIRVGILICFEIRFTSLIERLKGVDIVVIPARWGKIRREHFITLTRAIAILNQCYVLACDASNDDCTAASSIITPMGEQHFNADQAMLQYPFNPKEIRKMRTYIRTGEFNESN